MIIWRCDRCKIEVKGDGMAGHEFDYIKHGFKSLNVPIPSMNDLCEACMKVAEEAALNFEKSKRTSKNDFITAALLVMPS